MFSPNSDRLDTGALFPDLNLTLPGGTQIHAPEEFNHPFQVILFYRGHWCSYCRTQLSSFQVGLSKLEAEGIGVIAASGDDEEQCSGTINDLGLTFPVAYGLPIEETAKTIGAFYAEAPAPRAPFLHSTGFVLGPDRRILVSVYSTGSIGRLVWQDVNGTVQYAKKRLAAAS